MELLAYQRFLVLIFIWLKGFQPVFAGISCGFDRGWCDWRNEVGSKFLWKQGYGQTDDRSSGPLNDHTCKNIMGKYLYVTGHDAKQMNSSAVIKSPPFSLDKESNMTFWYSMNGVGIGQLILSKWVEGQKTEIWSRKGRQGSDWMEGAVVLKPGNMSLEFSATARLHYGSDLALDDIHLQTEPRDFSEKYCELTTTTSTSTSTTTTQSTTHTTTIEPKYRACETDNVSAADILPGSCNFEENLCGNNVSVFGRFVPITWMRTDQAKYGIDGDHTHLDKKSSKGFYMQFQNGFPWGNDKYSAKIETPPINRESICLSFWYNTPSTYSNLNVSVNHGNVSREVWKREKSISGTFLGWYQAVLSIKQKPPFSIVFLTYNKNHKAYVGIDDILIVGSSKRVPTPFESTTPFVSSTKQTTPKSVFINTSAITSATRPLQSTSTVDHSTALPSTSTVSSVKPVVTSSHSSIPASNYSVTTSTASSLETTISTTNGSLNTQSTNTVTGYHNLSSSSNPSYVSKALATNSTEAQTTTVTNVAESSSTKAPTTLTASKYFSSRSTTVPQTTDVVQIINTTSSLNTTLAMKTTNPSSSIHHTITNGSHNNLSTKYLTEEPKVTKKPTIGSTTEQITKKPKPTKKPGKQTEDESQHQTDNDDASDPGLPSLVIAIITVACVCAVVILVLTVYILLPKLRKSKDRPKDRSSSNGVNGHVHQNTNTFTLANGKSEHMNGGLKFLNINNFQTDLGTKSDKVQTDDVERISISTKL